MDFTGRIVLVGLLLLIFMKLRSMDSEIIKSVIYLKFNRVRRAFYFVLLFSPFFLAASLLEYPDFVYIYGEEKIHFLQDTLLFFFQIGVIYFLAVAYRALDLPGN